MTPFRGYFNYTTTTDGQASFSCSGHLRTPANPLEQYNQRGISFLNQISGEFSALIIDPSHATQYLIRDKIGIFPLYYAIRNSEFYYSQNLKDFFNLYGFDFAPDSEGLADFLLPGRNPNPDLKITSFANIFAVKPGHYLQINQQGVKEFEYWDFNTSNVIYYSNKTDYVAHFRELYIQAVKRRLSLTGNTAVSLSGGLDSSTLYAVANTIKSTDHNIIGVSYTSDIYGDCDEKIFLKLLADKYVSSPILQYRIEDQDDFLSMAYDQTIAIEEPFIDYLWPVTRNIYQLAQSSDADVLLTGHWGDQLLFSQDYLLDFLKNGQIKKIREHLRQYKKWCTPTEYLFYRNYFVREAIKLFLPQQLIKLVRQIKGLIKKPRSDEVLSPLLHFSSAESGIKKSFHSLHAQSLYQIVKSKYHVRCMEWNFKTAQHFNMKVTFPMLDEDLIQFLISIPGDAISSDGIPRNIIREAFKEILPESITNRTWKADFTEVVNSRVENEWLNIVRILQDDPICVKSGLANPAELNKRLKWSRGSDCSFSWEIIDYLGLELWFKYFGGNNEKNRTPYKEKIYQTEIRSEGNSQRANEGQGGWCQ